MKLLSLKVPDSLDHRLTHAASCRKNSKSEVVCEALTAFLAETGGEEAGSALTLAKPSLVVSRAHRTYRSTPLTYSGSAVHIRASGFLLRGSGRRGSG
jgi:hypothetical protein